MVSGVPSTNPIPVAHLPQGNPFLEAAAIVRGKRGNNDSANQESALQGAFATESVYPITPTAIQTAGPAGYFDNTVEHGHGDDAYRAMAASLYVRKH